MMIIFKQSDQLPHCRREYWNWCFANGFVATEVADQVAVDTGAATVTVQRWLPIAQPGDPDFPELRRDEFNRPLSEIRVYPLRVAPPPSLIAEIGQLAA